MDRDKLKAQLARHEGYRQFPYKDTVGKLTVGYGRNLTDVGLSRDEAGWLMERDIEKVEMALSDVYPWFESLDPVRKAVLVNMGFNLGMTRLGGFKNTLRMIESEDYEGAALGMLHSKWASQVKGRALELAEMMKTGRWSK